MQIAIVNQSHTITDAQVAAAAVDLNTQIQRDVGPAWNVSGAVFACVRGIAPPPGAAQVLVLDDSDQPGALGYHSVTPQGRPIAKVFAHTDQLHGLSWTVTTSHEVVEMIVDPLCVQAAQIGQSSFAAWEACDPCEADRFGYLIGTTHVSDFVLPAWFTRGPGPYDFGHHITAPLSLLPGGYMSVWAPGAGWTQKFAETDDGSISRLAQSTRNELRNSVWLGVETPPAPVSGVGQSDPT